MREFEDAPPLDCPACGAPTPVEFTADARCPACDARLIEAAEAARVAISSLRSTLRDLPALPPRLQASLKARLFEFDQRLDAALAAPVAAHAPAEALVDVATAAEQPVEEPRAAEEPLAHAPVEPVEEPAEEPADEPPVTQITPPPAEPAAPVRPGLWQRLGPAFAENLMFFLGGFLLLAGALYFVSTAWTTMTGAAQLLVIEGGILCFGAALVGAGRLLNRDGTLDDLDRVLATAGGACTAFAALAVGRLLRTDLMNGVGGLALWLAAGFAINTWALRRLGLADRRRTGGLMLACLGAVVAPVFMGWPVALAALSVAIATALAARQEAWPAHALAAIAAGVAVVQVALHTDAWGVLALPLAGAAIVYSRLARARAQAHDLFAVGMAIAAFVIGLLSPNAALICAAAGGVVAARAAVHRERAALLIAAFLLGLAAYVLLPAPIRGIVLALKAKAAAGLGYSGGRLPLAWYGVTCLPYVALCGVVAHRLAKAGLDGLAQAARGWTLGVAAALCVLAFTTLDLRAPLVVLPAEGLLLLGLAFWLKSTRMAYAAPVLLAAAPILAVLHFHLPTSVVPLGIAAIALLIRATLRRGPVVHALYKSCACLLAGAAGMAIVPPAFMDHSVHWIDLFAAPLLVLAIWPVPQLRPLGLLALHRMIPALVALTGIWTWPAALIVAIGATLILKGHKRDRLRALSGWALLLVAISGAAYAPPFGVDATIGLLGVALLGVTLAWGTAHSTLAAVGLLAFAGAAASVAWIYALRPSRVGMAAAVTLSLGVVALGWLHRRKAAIFARVGRAPTRMAVLLAGVAVFVYIMADVAGVVSKRSLIILAAGALMAMAAAPRLPRHAQPWMLIGGAAAWLLMRGVLGVLPWTAPAGLAAMLAAALFCALLRWAPRALPMGDEPTRFNWRQLVFVGLILVAHAPVAPMAALPLLVAIGLCIWRDDLVADALGVAAVALLVAGPVVTPLLGAQWAPASVFAVVLVGRGLRRFAWAPRSAGGLAVVALTIWAFAMGPELLEAVLEARTRPGAIDVGVGWIAAAAAAWLYVGRGRLLGIAAALPLLWWAPIASVLGDGPARAAPSIAALALIMVALRKTRPVLSPYLFAALGLTAGLWSQALTPTTTTLVAATLIWAAARYGRARDIEGVAIIGGLAAVVGVLWIWPWRFDLAGLGLLGAVGVATGLRCSSAMTVSVALFAVLGVLQIPGHRQLWATPAAGLALALLGVIAWRRRGSLSVAACLAPVAATLLLCPLVDWPLVTLMAGAAGLTSAVIARRRAALIPIGAGLAALAWICMLGVGWAAPPIGAGGVALIIGTAALLIGWGPRLEGRPKAVHGLIAILATLHLALAQATPWLAVLSGHHLEVWIVLAALVAATASMLPDAARRELLVYFGAIPMLALLLADDAAGVARAAFLGSVTLGFASRQARALRYAAFALANVGAWAFCLTLDLVDPTLYGLPPGLTLLALAEVERGRLSVKAHLALLVSGFALAYGGMAVQIVTVGGALHAAMLLVAGLISVGLGWRARRADLLIGGTAAVVLDVICYLVRHGFQQDFISAGLLLFAGATVLLAATVAAKMRRSAG